MRRLVVAALLALAGCGFSVTAAGWQDANLHVVDGIWLAGETPCTTGPTTVCGALVREATRRLTLDERTRLSRAAIAELPHLYQLSTGGLRSVSLFSGVLTYVAVVLDIGESRKVVGLTCHIPTVLDSDGACAQLDGLLDRWRVGAPEPTMYSSPG